MPAPTITSRPPQGEQQVAVDKSALEEPAIESAPVARGFVMKTLDLFGPKLERLGHLLSAPSISSSAIAEGPSRPPSGFRPASFFSLLPPTPPFTRQSH